MNSVFYHNKSANSTFSHDLSAKRIGQMIDPVLWKAINGCMHACMLGGSSSCSVCILFILLVKDNYTSEKQFLFSNDAVKGALNED